MREYTVFNVEQCENLPERVVALGEMKPRNSDERERIDEFLACSGDTIREGSGEAYYRPGDDVISLLRFEAFKNAAQFPSTAFHEHGHWSGHKSRLARDLRHRFGERAYAAEELVAELCSAFICAEFSIDGDLRHAGLLLYSASMSCNSLYWRRRGSGAFIPSWMGIRPWKYWVTCEWRRFNVRAVCPS
jgi:antirestriction protein ArdC